MDKDKNYKLYDVFTPTKPARITFVEREAINNRIVRALKTPGTQLIIYGHSGSGKTTLLENKLFQVYEKHIKTNCMLKMTFDQIILDAFDQLKEFYCDEVTNSRKNTIDVSAQTSYLTIQGTIKKTAEDGTATRNKRILPPQLTAQNLGRLMGAAGYCWVLEDFHKVAEDEKEGLSQTMKVFMDMSDQYPDLKIIAIGAVNTAREVVGFDKEMRHRVSEIHVNLMTQDETNEIISKGCDALNIEIDQNLKNEISHYSNGLAAICHKICYLLCDSVNIIEKLKEPYGFDMSELQAALSEYCEDESDTIKMAVDKALKVKNSNVVLRAMTIANRDGARIQEIYDEIELQDEKLSIEEVAEVLAELQLDTNGEIVKTDNDSECYSFSDPFLRSFILAYFEERDRTLTKRSVTKRENAELLNMALKLFIQKQKSSDETHSDNVRINSIEVYDRDEQ